MTRRPHLVVVAALLAACPADPSAGDDDVDTEPVGPADSDAAGDSEPAEPDTVVADSDGVDTDLPSDTDTDLPVDTDPVDDSDTTDTEPPVDTADSDGGPTLPTFVGAFTDLTAAAWSTGRWFPYTSGPLAWPSEVPAALGDLDGDGVDDVIANTVGDHDRRDAQAWPLRRQADGAFAPDAGLSDALDPWYRDVLAVVDLDGDGLTDLVRSSMDGPIALGEPGTLARTPVNAEVVRRSGRVNAGVSVSLVDVDNDGWLDLFMGQEACGTYPPVTVLHRTGPRSWQERIDLAPVSPLGGMRVVQALPLATPGSQFFFAGGWDCVGKQHPAFYRPTGLTWDGLPTFAAYDATPADAWFKQTPSGFGFYVNASSPMGTAVLDLDGDGTLELLVTVAPERQFVYRLDGTPWLDDVTATLGFDFPKLPGTTEREAWGVVPFDLDLDGRPDLAIAQGDDAVAADLPLDTRVSYPRVFWNDGAGGMHDVADRLGLDTVVGNWHALLAGDVDHDLDVDLLVGGYGFLPRLWRNDTVAAGHPLVLRLRGTTSNHLGAGARVRVEADGLPAQVRVMGDSGSPGVVASPTLWLGIGANPVARRVEVTWPSGLVQVLEDVPAGELTVEEPPTLTLSDVDRHVVADGVGTVEVVVTPRSADGSPRAVGAVVLRLAQGTGAWVEAAAVQDGDAWRRTLVAPSTAGVAVIEALIDGVPVRVRPRVWWDEPPTP